MTTINLTLPDWLLSFIVIIISVQAVLDIVKIVLEHRRDSRLK